MHKVRLKSSSSLCLGWDFKALVKCELFSKILRKVFPYSEPCWPFFIGSCYLVRTYIDTLWRKLYKETQKCTGILNSGFNGNSNAVSVVLAEQKGNQIGYEITGPGKQTARYDRVPAHEMEDVQVGNHAEYCEDQHEDQHRHLDCLAQFFHLKSCIFVFFEYCLQQPSAPPYNICLIYRVGRKRAGVHFFAHPCTYHYWSLYLCHPPHTGWAQKRPRQ